ncbi:aa3-type cytochrome c oxidase subunit IV [Phenylobacterium sp. J426]|uniref:aa3-type cytochrome c oxidase subunit IV n=1 Tax=Phenylobacterium sp. J426 TaxID=2898439 RepID=UPI00215168DB|nr:aa3-type cytochrome c oxidase subunit IV [Phenylobacterium sp. J426]MCR5874422.1 aa3-type cytochrome c oxidase subunit IV [Phenylobacterium sp. J426]
MAGPASDYHRGEMDIAEQTSTYKLVMGITKWGSLYLAAAILALTIWFCTEAGFMAGLISAVVLIVLGTLVLRDKKGGAAH